jgi:hypothetical protein
MNRKTIFLLTFFLAVPALVGASDEIILKSGRTLTGHITSESDTAYRIKLGPSMYLSVAKDEVASVSREKPAAGPSRPTVRLEQITSTGTAAASAPNPAVKRSEKKPSAVEKPVHAAPHAASAPSTAPRKHAAATPPSAKKPAVAKVSAAARSEEAVSTDSVKVGAALIEKRIVYEVYDIEAPSFEAARKAVMDPSAGKGFLEGQERRAGRTTWDGSWSGIAGPGGKQWKAVVVVATVTVTLPRWRNAAQADAAEAEQWNAFLKDASDHQASHVAIINDGLISFGQSVSNLNDPAEKELRAETATLFKSTQDRISKRRQGYERRRNNHPIVPIKKKPAPSR